MATLWAFRATDMRVEIARGFLTSFDVDSIVVSDGPGVDTFRGRFGFRPDACVPAPFDPFCPGPVDPFPPRPSDFPAPLLARTFGTLAGFDVTLGSGFVRYTVDGLDADARVAFQLLALRGTADFQRFVFAGDDAFFGSRFADSFTGHGGNDILSGLDGADRLIAGNGLDRLYGGDGGDVMTGGNQRDWLNGGDGDDLLAGSQGSDFLRGEDGGDVLIGGLGRDFLTGGPGADSFRFQSIRDSQPGSGARDRIEDFSSADRVDLRPIDASLERQGSQPFVFIADDPFTGQAGQLRFDPADRLLMGDTTGDGEADFEVEIDSETQITAADLLL